MKPTLRAILFLMLAIPVLAVAGPQASDDKCYSCHREIGDKQSAGFQKDIHFLKGVSCAGCHGGDSKADDQDKAMDRSKGYIGKPTKAGIVQMCAKCHGNESAMKKFGVTTSMDEIDDFKQSVHAASSGEANGVQCISCHGVHGMLPKSDPASPVNPLNVPKTCANCHSNIGYMRQFNPSLGVDQYEKYLTSVHGKNNAHGDSKVATCASCHSNHRILPVKDPGATVYPSNVPAMCAKCHSDAKYMEQYHIKTDQFDLYRQSVHGEALLTKGDHSAPACNSCHGNHGASPPGGANVANICGSCHAFNADLFNKSVHKEAFAKQGLPECGVCHSNHLIRQPSDTLIGTTTGTLCGKCHNDPKDKAALTINKVRATLDSLNLGHVHAEGMLNSAEQLGMDVADAKYSLKDVNQSLVQARVQVHAFDAAPLEKAAEPGLRIVGRAQQSALEAAKDFYFRRQGLGVATLVFSALALALYLKIRSIERKS